MKHKVEKKQKVIKEADYVSEEVEAWMKTVVVTRWMHDVEMGRYMINYKEKPA